jgi:tripartite-type tricarboxylate transporter receptor subunit TctC
MLAQKLTESWGQQFIVENRAGANGIIGVAAVAKSKPDGYTLLVGVSSAIAMNPFVNRYLSTPEFRERMSRQGSEAAPSTPEAFAAFIKAEAGKWSKVIRAAGLEYSQ